MAATCPSCEASLPASELQADRQFARCSACDVTVQFGREADSLLVRGFTVPLPPAGVVVETDSPPMRSSEGYRDAVRAQGEFSARSRWRPRIFATMAVLFLDTCSICSLVAAVMSGAPSVVAGSLVMLAVAIGVTWGVAASWLNTTRVEVRDGQLTCAHGPIPVVFDNVQSVPLEDVVLFEIEAVSRLYLGSKLEEVGWQVVATTRDRRRFPVVTRVEDEAQARFLRRRLERQL